MIYKSEKTKSYKIIKSYFPKAKIYLTNETIFNYNQIIPYNIIINGTNQFHKLMRINLRVIIQYY